MKRGGFSSKAPPRKVATQCSLIARPRPIAAAVTADTQLPMAAPVAKFAYVRDERFQAMCRAMACQHCGASGPDAGVTWAHSNQSKHGKGKGVKASDERVAALCHGCHAELDQGRANSLAQKIAMWDWAHWRTVAEAICHGLWPADVPIPAEFKEWPMSDVPPLPAPMPPGVTVRTLVDGTIVTSDSREWHQECLHWHRHVLNLRGRPIEFIKGYVSDVRRSEGEEAAKRLKQAYADDWQSLQRPGQGQQGGPAA